MGARTAQTGRTSTAARRPSKNADHADQATETRKLRNRLSQKAYRARQALHIKELEERLDTRPSSESGRLAELEDRNTRLCNQLLDCHKKIESFQITLQSLADATAGALGIQPQTDHVGNRTHAEIESSSSPEDWDVNNDVDVDQSPSSAEDPVDLLDKVPIMDDFDQRDGDTIELMPNGIIMSSEIPQMTGTSSVDEYFPQATTLPSPPAMSNELMRFVQSGGCGSAQSQLPLHFSFSQMGPEAYKHVTGTLLVSGPLGELRRTSSLFSDHITVVEHFLQTKWVDCGPLLSRGTECLASSVSFMFSAFVCMSWQMMTAWHTYTKAHIPVSKLIIWRLNPTVSSYKRIPPCYQPTRIQIAIPHPAIIDWIPWPAMRDKLILCHSANPCLDDLICEIGNSYVVQADLSTLIAGIMPVIGYVSVWDMIRAIAPEATSGNTGPSPARACGEDFNVNFDPNFTAPLQPDSSSRHSSLSETGDTDGADNSMPESLPARNAGKLFGTKALALQAFYLLGMDRGAVTFRLDPAFFESHPELYCPEVNLLAHGVPLRPPERGSIPLPQPLDSSLLGRYRELTEWTFGLSFEDPHVID